MGPQTPVPTDRPMFLEISVDCGNSLFPGHRFVVTGLSDDGWSADDLRGPQDIGREPARMTSLLFHLVPGAEAHEMPADDRGGFPVTATYAADVPLPWSTGGTGPGGLGGPGGHEEFAGGASTSGDFGPWPVPREAQHLTFWLRGAASGALHVDLERATVDWRPGTVEP